jgi:hypothetical protein
MAKQKDAPVVMAQPSDPLVITIDPATANPVYSYPGRTDAIDLMVQITGYAGDSPFTATQDAADGYVRVIYNDCVAGAYGPVGPYVPPAAAKAELRANGHTGESG